MAGRYTLPEPQCRHARRGIVTSGGGVDEGHAATNVCDRPECIADAIAWAEAFTRLPAKHIPDRRPELTLFPEWTG
jgi:hypothetical protein